MSVMYRLPRGSNWILYLHCAAGCATNAGEPRSVPRPSKFVSVVCRPDVRCRFNVDEKHVSSGQSGPRRVR
jgi:hypothetical protein